MLKGFRRNCTPQNEAELEITGKLLQKNGSQSLVSFQKKMMIKEDEIADIIRILD